MLALTHRSWCAESPGDDSNERLEFLGDAVLGLVVTDALFERYPERSEGELAKTRAAVVSAATLADVGSELGIGSELRLGRGEETSGGREKPSILSDAVEAVIGAVYLDAGLDAARAVVLNGLGERLATAAAMPGKADHKTRLQELAARAGLPHPHYAMNESGPDHDKRFHAVVTVGEVVAGGDGTTKKEAEQNAAGAAWARLAGNGEPAVDRVEEDDVRAT